MKCPLVLLAPLVGVPLLPGRSRQSAPSHLSRSTTGFADGDISPCHATGNGLLPSPQARSFAGSRSAGCPATVRTADSCIAV